MCRPALIALGCLLLTSQAQAKLKVFILAGQSNMQGAGAIKINPKSKNGGQGTLEYLVKDERLAKRLAHVVDASGDWVVRDDVWIKYF
ncbi:MAG: sialate O-acetylesterase, partial [Verrucomicrobiota bacterium]|nr:sialate O-acetylesterase [Verrucomicrobiota bacterium]